MADYQVPARIRQLRIEDRQPLPGLSVVEAERRLTVKPGYFADLLVVRGDPVSSITATRSVALVIKSGRIVFAEDPALYRPGMSDTRERRVPRFMDRGHGAGDPAGVP